MNLEDKSTRKLKRLYLKTLRTMWQYYGQGFDNLAAGEQKAIRKIEKELSHRGWPM